jgi:hypothetical protein
LFGASSFVAIAHANAPQKGDLVIDALIDGAIGGRV